MKVKELLLENLSPGMVLDNPKKGVSEIVSINEERIVYKRGYSKIGLPLQAIEDTISKFSGEICSSSHMRLYKPEVFSSKHNGHSCNCTFMFMILKEVGYVDKIYGRGVSGNPFYVLL